MAPFRRRKAARNLALAEAALALAQHRTGGRRRSRGPSAKLLLIGGAVAAAGAVALLKRDKVAGLLPQRSGEPAYSPPAPPQPSNYDAPGPVANTATPIPAPDPHGEPPATIDESSEEAAAAAEAAAIGGTPSDYAGSEQGESADEAFRPLAEAGEGEAEGQEQAEAELAHNATDSDASPSDAERQIDDAIEEAGQPLVGEHPAPLAPADTAPDTDESAGTQSSFLPPQAAGGATAETPATPATGAPAPGAGSATEPESGAPAADTPATPGTPPTQPSGEDDQGGDDWRTWSGRSVDQ
jgi:hypothetical protein